jgi:hypothetical protein
MLIELQSHSTVSDGQLAPAEVVERAAEAGVTTLALTDHDAIAGVSEAARAAEGLGLELVPAIEMSCVHEYAEDLHVCGYWIDLGGIAGACERAQHERVTRAGEIVEKLRGEGFDLRGPLPADTAFLPAKLLGFDAVLAMYHDQGLPVLKSAGIDRAVNITLGLPYPRVAVDHGTALDIAGKGSADPSSLFAAIAECARMATHRKGVA